MRLGYLGVTFDRKALIRSTSPRHPDGRPPPAARDPPPASSGGLVRFRRDPLTYLEQVQADGMAPSPTSSRDQHIYYVNELELIRDVGHPQRPVHQEPASSSAPNPCSAKAS
jgi:hypothetical protein